MNPALAVAPGRAAQSLTAAPGRSLTATPDFTPRDYQVRAFNKMRAMLATGKKRILVVSPTGCHERGQLVMMHDGSLRAIEDVLVGDRLMGPDGQPRTVQWLCRGRGEMVRIVPTKGRPFVVNRDHVLTLLHVPTGRIVDVSVRAWQDWSNEAKQNHELFRVVVGFRVIARTGFTIEPVGEDDYFGFTLDGDGRYLLDDFTVTHNSGKTVLSAMMIRSAVARGTETLFLAHVRELIDQPSRKLDELGIDHNIIMAAHPRSRPWLKTHVASVQTLVRRLDSSCRPSAGLIIVDEAHHARASTYERILSAYPGVPVIGLTATPWRTDGKGLGDLFQDSYLVATPADLVDEGWLVPVDGFAFDSPDLRKVKKVAGEYSEQQLGAVMGGTKIVGNIVESWLAHARGLRTVVFAVHVQHSQDLAAAFRARGVPAEHLDGTTPVDLREATFARLHTGQTQVLCNVGICTEGWDEPLLGCVVLARPTMSAGLALQMIGRGRRPAPGKSAMRLHDHAGVVMQHGLPDDERDWSLTAGSQPRGPGVQVASVRCCSQCFALYSPSLPACPSCGAAPVMKPHEVQEIDGEAVPLEKLKKFVVEPEETMRKRYARMVQEAREKGWKPGAAMHRFKGRYGYWPPASWGLGGAS